MKKKNRKFSWNSVSEQAFSIRGWLYTCYQPGARRGGVICWPQGGWGSLAARGGGHQKPPLSCQHWVWEGWWRGTITKMVKGIASWEFPKEQSLVEDKPESGTQKYSKCQTPPYEKNKLLLNEYLGEFMHFETLFFYCGNGSDPPAPP